MILRNIISDKYLRVVFGLAFLILIFNFIFVYLSLGDAAGSLIIHFDQFKHIDFLGSRIEVFGILITAFLMILLNTLLSEFLHKRERFISFIFGFSSLALSVLILIVISVIVSVN